MYSLWLCSLQGNCQFKSMIQFRLLFCTLGCLLTLHVLPATENGEFDFTDPPMGVFYDEWSMVTVNGQHVGFEHSMFVREKNFVRSKTETETVLGRGTDQVKIKTIMETLEHLNGEPVAFVMTNQLGHTPIKMTGTFENGVLKVTTQQGSSKRDQDYLIDPSACLSWGTSLKMLEAGFTEGTHYQMLVYDPALSVSKAIRAEFDVFGQETIDIAGEKMTAHRVHSRLFMDNQIFKADSWHNEQGDTLKTSMQMGTIELVMYQTTRVVAIAAPEPDSSFFNSLMIRSNERIPDHADSVRLKVIFSQESDAPPGWPETYQQKLISSKGNESLLRIQRSDLDYIQDTYGPPVPANGSKYLDSTPYLNHEDPLLKKYAEAAVGDAERPVDKARKLHAFAVSKLEPSLDVGLATASEVARNLRGDCTEHAVFLAAMGRAVSIPSRVVTGLVYIDRFMDQKKVFGAHAWTQFYINGQWVDFDCAIGPAETAPLRIAFATSAMEESTPTDLSISMTNLLGKIEIEVIDIE